jgi:hypothetical protein
VDIVLGAQSLLGRGLLECVLIVNCSARFVIEDVGVSGFQWLGVPMMGWGDDSACRGLHFDDVVDDTSSTVSSCRGVERWGRGDREAW